MTKVLAVLGATGAQGGSVVDWVASNKELSEQYSVRAITRDPESAKSKKLAAKVEVVQGDVTDQKSLTKAFQGVHTLFLVTNPTFGPGGLETEFQTGKTIVDTAVQQGVQYLIFSSLPGVTKASNGKYTHAGHFDSKAKIEDYIRSHSIKSSFIVPGSFMANFSSIPLFQPQRADDGSYVLSFYLSPDDHLPFIDVAADLGKFVGAILERPDEYLGKTVVVAERNYTYKEMAAILSKASGKSVIYKQISIEDFKAKLPFGADAFVSVLSYIDEFGYYGPQSDQLVEKAPSQVKEKLNSLEDYFKAHPLSLE